MLTLLRVIEMEDLELLSSEVLAFEVDRIPEPNRKAWAAEVLALASQVMNSMTTWRGKQKDSSTLGLTDRRVTLGFSGRGKGRLFLYLR